MIFQNSFGLPCCLASFLLTPPRQEEIKKFYMQDMQKKSKASWVHREVSRLWCWSCMVIAYARCTNWDSQNMSKHFLVGDIWGGIISDIE